MGRKLVAGEVVIALDGPGDQGGEVQRIKQIRAESNVPLLVSVSCLDDQVEYPEEDV